MINFFKTIKKLFTNYLLLIIIFFIFCLNNWGGIQSSKINKNFQNTQMKVSEKTKALSDNPNIIPDFNYIKGKNNKNNLFINGETSDIYKFPGIEKIARTDLKNTGSIKTISLQNLGLLNEITFKNLSNTKLSELSFLNIKNENIGYYIDSRYTSDKFNGYAKDGNYSIGKMTRILNDNIFSDSLPDKYLDLNDGFYDISVKFFKPTTVSTISMGTPNPLNASNLSIEANKSNGERLVSKEFLFKDSKNFDGSYSIGFLNLNSSTWSFANESKVKKYYLNDMTNNGVGYTSFFYNGDFGSVLNGSDQFYPSKIKIGSVKADSNKAWDFYVASNAIDFNYLFTKINNNKYLNYLKNNRFLKLVKKSCIFDDPNFSFNKTSQKFKKLNFFLPISSPVHGLFNVNNKIQDRAFIRIDELLENNQTKLSIQELENLEFKYSYQKRNSDKNSTHWTNWTKIDIKKQTKIVLNGLFTKYSSQSIRFLVSAKNGNWLNKIGNTQEEIIYPLNDFKREVNELKFYNSDIGIDKGISTLNMSNLGNVTKIHIEMRADTPWLPKYLIDEIDVFDKNNNQIKYTVINYQNQKWKNKRTRKSMIGSPANLYELDGITKFLSDDIIDNPKKSVSNINKDSNPNNDMSIISNWKNANLKSQNTNYIFSAYKYSPRLNSLPVATLRLNKPQPISKLAWHFESGGNHRFFNLEFELDNGKSYVPSNPKINKHNKWKTFGEGNNFNWSVSNEEFQNKVSPKNLAEINPIYGGQIKLFGNGISRWSNRGWNAIIFYDDQGRKIPWKLDQKAIRMQHGNFDSQSSTHYNASGVEKSLRAEDSIYLTPRRGGVLKFNQLYHWAPEFNFIFTDGLPHRISNIKFISSSSTLNINKVKRNSVKAFSLLLNSKNGTYSLDNLDGSISGVSNSSNQNVRVNVGKVPNSTIWKYKSWYESSLSILQSYFDISRISSFYKWEIYDDLNDLWVSLQGLKLGNIINSSSIKIRTSRYDGAILYDGNFYKEYKLDYSKYNLSLVEEFSIRNIGFNLSDVKVIGIDGFGLINNNNYDLLDGKIALKYKVTNSQGKSYVTLEKPKSLSNGDQVTIIFYSVNPAHVFIDPQGQYKNLSNQWTINLPIINNLPKHRNINLLNEIPNLQSWTEPSNYNPSFFGVNGRGAPTSTFIKAINKLKNISQKFNIIIFVDKGIFHREYNVNDFENIDYLDNMHKISIIIEAVGHQTFSYNKSIEVKSSKLVEFPVSNYTNLVPPKKIKGINRGLLKNKIHNDWIDTKLKSTSFGIGYIVNKNAIITFAKKNNLSIQLEVFKNNNLTKYKEVSLFPSYIPDNSTIKFIFSPLPSHVFMNGSLIANKQQFIIDLQLFSSNLVKSKMSIEYTQNISSIISDDFILNYLMPMGVFDLTKSSWVKKIWSLGYSAIIEYNGKIYKLLDGTISHDKDTIIYLSNDFEEMKISIFPDSNHEWVSKSDGLTIPESITKIIKVKDLFQKDDISHLRPHIDGSVQGYLGSAIFVDENGKSEFFKNRAQFSKNHKVKFYYIPSQSKIPKNTNLNNLTKYNFNVNPKIPGEIDLSTTLKAYKNGDQILVYIERNDGKMLFNNAKSFLKIIKYEILPRKIIIPKIETSSANSYFEIDNSTTLKYMKFGGQRINWNDFLQDYNEIIINTYKADNKHVIDRTIKITNDTPDEARIISRLKENDIIDIVVNRGRENWWGDDFNYNGGDSIKFTITTPPYPLNIIKIPTYKSKFIDVKAKFTGINGNSIINNISFNAFNSKGSNNLPLNYSLPMFSSDFNSDKTTKPYNIKIKAFDSEDNKLFSRIVNLNWDKNVNYPAISDISLEKLPLKNGDYLTFNFITEMGYTFNNNNNYPEFNPISLPILDSNQKILKLSVNGLLESFFEHVDVGASFAPKVKGINKIYAIFDDVFSVYQKYPEAFGSNIKIFTYPKGTKILKPKSDQKSYESVKKLFVMKNGVKRPIENGDFIQMYFLPNKSKYIINPEKIDPNTGHSVNDYYEYTYIIENLQNGVNIDNFNEMKTKKTLILANINDKIMVSPTIDLIKCLNNNINDITANLIVNNPQSDKYSISWEAFKNGYTFSKDSTKGNYLSPLSSIDVVFITINNKVFYDPNDYLWLKSSDSFKSQREYKIAEILSEKIAKYSVTSFGPADFGHLLPNDDYKQLNDFRIKWQININNQNLLDFLSNGLKYSLSLVDQEGKLLINNDKSTFFKSINIDWNAIKNNSDSTNKLSEINEIELSIGDLTKMVTNLEHSNGNKALIEDISNIRFNIIKQNNANSSLYINKKNVNSIFLENNFSYVKQYIGVSKNWKSIFDDTYTGPEAKSNSYKGNFALLWDTIKPILAISSDEFHNDFYYNLTVFKVDDHSNIIQNKEYEDIFDFKTNYKDLASAFKKNKGFIPKSWFEKLNKNILREIIDKNTILVFKAHIWNDNTNFKKNPEPSESLFEKTNYINPKIDEFKTFNGGKGFVKVNNRTEKFLTYYYDKNLPESHAIIDFVNRLNGNNFYGVSGSLSFNDINVIRDIKGSIIRLEIFNEYGVKIWDMEAHSNNVKEIESLLADFNERMQSFQNGMVIKIKLSPLPNNVLFDKSDPANIIKYYKNDWYQYETEINSINIKVPMINNLDGSELKYSIDLNGNINISYNFEKIFGKDWQKTIKKMLLFSYDTTSLTGVKISPQTNLNYDELINSWESIKNLIKKNDIINLTISSKKGYLFDGNNRELPKTRYVLSEFNLVKDSILFSPFDKINFKSAKESDSGEKVSGFSQIELPQPINKYNASGLEVKIKINDFEYIDTLPPIGELPKNGDRIIIYIYVPHKNSDTNVMELPNGEKINIWTKTFTVKKLLEPIPMAPPKYLSTLNNVNNYATIKIDWINHFENLNIKYIITNKNNFKNAITTDQMPINLSNGDSVKVEIVPKSGFLIYNTLLKKLVKILNLQFKENPISWLKTEIEHVKYDDGARFILNDKKTIKWNKFSAKSDQVKIFYELTYKNNDHVLKADYFTIEDLIHNNSPLKSIVIIQRTKAKNFFFNIAAKVKEVKSPIYTIYSKIIDLTKFITPFNEMNSNKGRFNLNKIKNPNPQIIKIDFSTDKVNFQSTQPQNIIPGTNVYIRVSPNTSMGKTAIILNGKDNVIDQKIIPKELIIDEKALNDLFFKNTPIVYSDNAKSIIKFSKEFINALTKLNTNISYNVVDEFGKVKYTSKIFPLTVVKKLPKISKNEHIEVFLTPKDNYLFSNHKFLKKLIKNDYQDNHGMGDKFIIYLSIFASLCMASIIASIIYSLRKRRL